MCMVLAVTLYSSLLCIMLCRVLICYLLGLLRQLLCLAVCCCMLLCAAESVLLLAACCLCCAGLYCFVYYRLCWSAMVLAEVLYMPAGL